MFGKQETFEIHLCREGRWQIDSTASSQDEAQAAAKKMLGQPGVSGVRVVLEATRGSTTRESVVFEETRTLNENNKIFVGDVDEAPICATVDALYGVDGRQVLNRLFRAYLDKNGVTATEVMHEFRELRRLLDADNLVMAGIGKVSSAQAKGREDVDVNERRDALFKFLDEITARARTVAERKLPLIRNDGFETVLRRIVADADETECDFLLRVAVARELVQQRSYFGKLAQTVDWVEPCEDPKAAELADTYISDTLTNAETLQDLLGTQDSLGAALGALVDLAQGVFSAEADGKPEDSPEAMANRLSALLADDGMPDSRQVLVDRVRRQLMGNTRLGRGDPDQEPEQFAQLVNKLMPEDTLVGGFRMAEALTHRQSHIINKGGLRGLKEATNRILPTLGDPVRKASYLIELSQSPMAATLGDEIVVQLEGLFIQPDSVRQIVRDNRPPNKKMQTVTSVYYKVNSSPLDGVLKKRIVNRLDELLARYITQDKILDKVDDPNRPLHVRAFMLLAMCSPDMLPEGEASKLAREIVVKHLRRKNFEDELVADVTPAEKERVLRDFHVQLHRCGFMQ